MPKYYERKEPVLDSYIMASVSLAGHQPDPQTGRYAELTYVPEPGDGDILEVRNALYRSARHLGYGLHVRMQDGGLVFAATSRPSDYWEPLTVWRRQRREAREA